MTQPPPRLRRPHALWGLAGLVALVLAIALIARHKEGDVPQDDLSHSEREPPAVTERRTDPQAGYVGSQRCQECHAPEAEAFHSTPHYHSLRRVVAADEPPDAHFRHELSGRSYSVTRDQEGLYHSEALLLKDGTEMPIAHHRLSWRVGSGHFGHTYLAELDGFLVQSPVTWYAPRREWSMSPGYDRPLHQSFVRTVPAQCLFCHSGQVQVQEENQNRLKIIEEGIACERCHGPGAEHVARQSDSAAETTGPDSTIVNPRRLSRSLIESVCGQCHLQGDHSAAHSHRDPTHFVPGKPLADYRHEYRRPREEPGMTIVGHVEQLRESLCYKKSDNLTCITCHQPHSTIEIDDPVERYRTICAQCHTPSACSLELNERIDAANDNCVACHMPASGTEVPHVAFTHHRIGRHPAPPDKPEPTELLIPLTDLSQLPPDEQNRSRGLVMVELVKTRELPAGADRDRLAVEAYRLLDSLPEKFQDATVHTAIAELHRLHGDTMEAIDAAHVAISMSDALAAARANACEILADAAFQQSDFVSAAQFLRQLTALRRNATDWFYLGMCETNLDRRQHALDAFNRSLQIEPAQSGAHNALIALYRAAGQEALAVMHANRVKQFQAAIKPVR